MKKYLIFLFSTLFLFSCDPAALDKLMQSVPLNNTDVAKGLKEALNFGVDDAVKFLSAEDGYFSSPYKILLPAEARRVTDKLSKVPGFKNVENEIIKKINRAAEDAAKSAGPIFLSAIKNMSFDDAMNILMGQQNAATQYLNKNTNKTLYGEFNPVINNSLNKYNALGYWADAVNSYNKIPFVDKINPDLSDHITNKALEGLFSLVEKKEMGIRTDLSQRTTDLLKKVFQKQDGQ